MCALAASRRSESQPKENYVKYVVHVNKCEIFISSKRRQKIYARQALEIKYKKGKESKARNVFGSLS